MCLPIKHDDSALAADMENFRSIATMIFALLVVAWAPHTPVGQLGLPAGADAFHAPHASAPAPTAEDYAEVEIVYLRFWQVVGTLDRKPEADWRSSLDDVAVDPELSRVIDHLGRLRAKSIGLYGSTSDRIGSITVTREGAVLHDCQNASDAGQVDERTGERVTVGAERTPVIAGLLRGSGGGWRVAEITYPGGEC